MKPVMIGAFAQADAWFEQGLDLRRPAAKEQSRRALNSAAKRTDQ